MPSVGLVPGAVALLSGGLTGVMVLYSDEESFAYMTPGAPLLGLDHLFRLPRRGQPDGGPGSTAHTRQRPALGAHDALGVRQRAENKQWQRTLRNVAAHFGAEREAETRVVCVDPKRQWRHYKNIRHNALIRSALRAATASLRKIAKYAWR